MAILETKDLRKIYGSGENEVHIKVASDEKGTIFSLFLKKV